MKHSLTVNLKSIILVVAIMLAGSCNEDPDTNILAKGFLEYQFSYTVDGEADADGNPVFHFAYNRVVTDDAFFVVSDQLPESLAGKGLRQVDLHVRSTGYSGLNVSSLGGSYVKIQLVDTLRFDPDQDKLLSYTYAYAAAASETSPRPVHLGFEGKMLLKEDAVNGGFLFEENITGQDRVLLFHLGDKQYEIIVNGICNERTYNFHYVGPVHQKYD
jgi:hypothetical protein